MIPWRTVLSLTVSGCYLYSGVADAGAIESSYRTARKVIDGAMVHMQAEQWLKHPVPVLVKASGTWNQGAEHQGYAPGEPTPAKYSETWAFDPDSGIVGREYRQLRPDGTSEWIRELFTGGDEQLLILLDSGRTIRLRGRRVSAARDRNLRRFPPLLLGESLQHPESLRSMGRYGPFNSVQVQTRDRQSLSLFFGRESHTLGWVEYLVDLPTFSDSTVSWKFSDYRPVEGVGRLPHRYAIHVNENNLVDMQVSEVSTDADRVRAFLSPPGGAPEPETIAIPGDRTPMAGARVERAGDGVYRIADLRGGFHTMFVEFDDFVLAVDAPSGYPLLAELPAGDVAPGISESALAEHAIGLIRETVGDKPLRYLVLTHFHNDHAGGLLAFAGMKVKLLAEASEIDSIRAFLGSEHTFCGFGSVPEPDRGYTLTVHPVHGRRVIADGSQRVEILDVGANPHTAHMLVIWLPAQRILYTADLLTGKDGRPDERHSKLNEHFLEWVTRAGLEPDVILTAHGGGFVYPDTGPDVASEPNLISPKDP